MKNIAIIIAILLGIEAYEEYKAFIPEVKILDQEVYAEPIKGASAPLRVKAIVFSAANCPPCNRLKSDLKAYQSYGWYEGQDGNTHFEFCELESDPEAHRMLKITKYPTVVFFVDDKEVSRYNGLTSLQVAEKWNQINRDIERNPQ